jgi:precorrin-6A/cobalt-precorrin-6A reductase
MRRILILGGTAEARQLGERLAALTDFAVTMSLAGRTASPLAQSVPVRVGGFGGAEGLAEYLAAERIDVLVDATHPYAAKIAASAVRAAALTRTALVALRRPPWIAGAGDRWIEVADIHQAVRALGAAPRGVFLAMGRKEIAPFTQAPQHRYLVRSVDPVDPPLSVPHASYVTARGPFREEDDRRLLQAHGIDVVVAKNSGGNASYSKIAAARMLGLEVIMLKRPDLPPVPSVATVDAAIAWLAHALASDAMRGV